MNSNSCPFCASQNHCAVDSKGCWCQSKRIPRALISLLPAHAKNRECICSACIERYQHDASAFKEGVNGKAQ
ncbi:cysteine-rich CWC family protein [Psychromonas hadalis]|uniref:cysteine-rich CWC family protein n=1 Tax=Psychromonas hadalis TaxID=211669 RepID=UPI0003B72373|nr:cysteine-rich CWC family protein [Psychromonas hadalis]